MGSQILFILLIGLCYGVSAYYRTGADTENYEYPCKSTDDWDCIRDFLASTGQCEKSSYRDGVPLKIQDMYTYVPSQNVSIVTKDTHITMCGSKILDMYLNKDTNNLVMALGFDSIFLSTPRAVFEFEQVRKEIFRVSEYINITHSAIITIIIAWSDYIKIDDLRASAYIEDSNPLLVIGPKLTQSSNKIVKRAYKGFMQNMPTVLKEIWVTMAYYFTNTFINKKLCDFGYVYDGRVNRP